METNSLVGPKFIQPPVETGARIINIVVSKNHPNAKHSHFLKMLSLTKKRKKDADKKNMDTINNGSANVFFKLLNMQYSPDKLHNP